MKKQILRWGSFVFAILIVLSILFPSESGAIGGWNFITMKVKTNFWAGSLVAGTDVFTTTAIRDTIAFAAGTVKSTDIWLLTAANDTTTIGLSYISKTDTLIAIRKASGGSATVYAYLRIVPK